MKLGLEQIPNGICVVRLLLTGPIVWLLATGAYEAGLVLFMIAGFSDGLDGFLARRFNWRTEVGAFLDPLADKVLMVSVFATCGATGLLPLWLIAVVILRDVVIVTGTISYRVLIGPLQGSATPVSKLNTVLQLLLITVTLANAATAVLPELVITVLGALVFVTSVVSGLDYVRDGTRRAIRASRETEAPTL